MKRWKIQRSIGWQVDLAKHRTVFLDSWQLKSDQADF